jgi:hypothetical protein
MKHRFSEMCARYTDLPNDLRHHCHTFLCVDDLLFWHLTRKEDWEPYNTRCPSLPLSAYTTTLVRNLVAVLYDLPAPMAVARSSQSLLRQCPSDKMADGMLYLWNWFALALMCRVVKCAFLFFALSQLMIQALPGDDLLVAERCIRAFILLFAPSVEQPVRVLLNHDDARHFLEKMQQVLATCKARGLHKLYERIVRVHGDGGTLRTLLGADKVAEFW